MCGILAVLGIKTDPVQVRRRALRLSQRLRHRGPDGAGIWSDDYAVLSHQRLAIVDPETGHQPLVDPESGVVLAANGEIYNHASLRQELGAVFRFRTKSDCEPLIPLYLRHGSAMLEKLEGMFAFVLYAPETQRFLIARDHVGIVPLYYGYDGDQQLLIASELKALVPACDTIHEFPPGHYFDSAVGSFERYYRPAWESMSGTSQEPVSLPALNAALVRSVRSHLMSDVPFGVLLSGGLDSSLVSAIAAIAHAEARADQSDGRTHRLHSFAIGLEGSPDLAAAERAAEIIGSRHHTMHFTVQEGLDALHDVIYALETYDLTTVRASTPMYLMARRIKALGIKMVLSGEGADEIFGGYLYFHNAPNRHEFHDECVRKVKRLHMFDCLRANKAMAAWGVEVRVPFLDRQFMDYAMSLDPEAKMCGQGRIEKQLLRSAFSGLLPAEILQRQKEQFSDGVGYRWIDSLKEYAISEVSDQQFAAAAERFPVNTPDSKEGYLYRSIFEEHFPHRGAIACVPSGKSIACSTPEAFAWEGNRKALADPSGRSVRDVHARAY